MLSYEDKELEVGDSIMVSKMKMYTMFGYNITIIKSHFSTIPNLYTEKS